MKAERGRTPETPIAEQAVLRTRLRIALAERDEARRQGEQLEEQLRAAQAALEGRTP